jgi:hypothetical protein
MKAKPIIFVIVTLIIGFVLGMLTSAQVRLHKLQPMRMYFSEERFREGFFNTIQPDEKQKAEIVEILDKYAAKNSDLQSGFRKELDLNMQEMRKELDSKLTREQIARLKEIDEKRQEMIRQNRKGRPDSLNQRNRTGGPQHRFQDGMSGPPPDRERPPYHSADTTQPTR